MKESSYLGWIPRKPYLALARWYEGFFSDRPIGWVVTFWWSDGSQRDVTVGTTISENWVHKPRIIEEALRVSGLTLEDEENLNAVQKLERQENVKL